MDALAQTLDARLTNELAGLYRTHEEELSLQRQQQAYTLVRSQRVSTTGRRLPAPVCLFVGLWGGLLLSNWVSLR